MVRIRTFEERDYERLAEISAAVDSDTEITAVILRHGDATREPHVRLLRLVAELEPAGMVGAGRIMHAWWSFHPRRFVLNIEVDPAWQSRGVGSALFESLMGELRAWDAQVVRVELPATREPSVAFLEHRGFHEWRRRWNSVLSVADANVVSLADAGRRVAEQNVLLTTYPQEVARRGDGLARELYEMEALIYHHSPAWEPNSQPMTFERFVATELETPDALPEAHFLAIAGGRVVGVSRLTRDSNHPRVLHQAFTGTHPDFRGRGIAQALKLRTIEFARERGFREIKTSNDSTNAPMLHINDALGFKRESPLVIFEHQLSTT